MLNNDYKDILQALSDEKADFILVGAYALAFHGFPRATMDIDIWIKPSPENADATLHALKRFGAPLHDLRKDNLLTDDTIFQIGVAPRRIDIMTGVSGLRFEEAFAHAVPVTIEGIAIRVLSLDDLILNKRASGRLKDLADAESLEKLKSKKS